MGGARWKRAFGRPAPKRGAHLCAFLDLEPRGWRLLLSNVAFLLELVSVNVFVAPPVLDAVLVELAGRLQLPAETPAVS